MSPVLADFGGYSRTATEDLQFLEEGDLEPVSSEPAEGIEAAEPGEPVGDAEPAEPAELAELAERAEPGESAGKEAELAEPSLAPLPRAAAPVAMSISRSRPQRSSLGLIAGIVLAIAVVGGGGYFVWASGLLSSSPEEETLTAASEDSTGSDTDGTADIEVEATPVDDESEGVEESFDGTGAETAVPAVATSTAKKPGVGKPGVGKPGVGKPGVGKPGVGKPGVGKPGVGKPGVGKPGVGKPGVGKPGVGKPGVGKPGVGKPGVGKPPAGAKTAEANEQLAEGTKLLLRGRHKEAAKAFTKATKLDPKLAKAFRGLGVCHERLGNTKAAKAAFARYLKLAPGAPDAAVIRKRAASL